MSFEQYPDTLTYGTTSVKCRFVPARGGNRVRKRQDGTEVSVSYDIAFENGTATIPLFTKINGFNKRGEFVVYNQELLLFHDGEFHCVGEV